MESGFSLQGLPVKVIPASHSNTNIIFLFLEKCKKQGKPIFLTPTHVEKVIGNTDKWHQIYYFSLPSDGVALVDMCDSSEREVNNWNLNHCVEKSMDRKMLY